MIFFLSLKIVIGAVLLEGYKIGSIDLHVNSENINTIEEPFSPQIRRPNADINYDEIIVFNDYYDRNHQRREQDKLRAARERSLQYFQELELANFQEQQNELIITHMREEKIKKFFLWGISVLGFISLGCLFLGLLLYFEPGK